jgi:hypothetical protein
MSVNITFLILSLSTSHKMELVYLLHDIQYTFYSRISCIAIHCFKFWLDYGLNWKLTSKLRGLSPQVNYTERLLSAKLVPTFSDEGVSRSQHGGFPTACFLDQSHYFFFQVAPQLYSWGWVDPVPDPLLRKSGKAGDRTRTSGYVARNSDH